MSLATISFYLSLFITLFVLFTVTTARDPNSSPFYPNPDVVPDESADGFYKWKSSTRAKRFAKYPNWMSQKKDRLKGRKLTDLFVPGTHDSGAYSLSKDVLPGQVDKQLEGLLNALKKIRIPAGEFLLPWSLTQDIDIYEQLVAGARFIDIRAGWDGKNWRFYHLLMGKNIDELLGQIRRFLDENREEVIFVEFTHLAGAPFGDNERNQLADMIERHLGDHMHQRRNLDITYGDVLNSGKRAFVSLGANNIVDGRNKFFYEGFIKNTWADKDDANLLVQYANDKVKEFNENPPNNQLYKISWTLTPTGDTATRGIWPGKPHTLIQLAKTITGNRLNDFIGKVSRETRRKTPGNILIFDIFQENSIDRVINLNDY